MENIWLSLLLPLGGALIIALLKNHLTYWEAFGVTLCSFILSFIFLAFSFHDLFSAKDYKIIYILSDFKWIDSGDFVVEIALYLDFLSAFLGLFVSGIGLIIICYSVEYFNKKEFPDGKRMLAYMNFSLFSILMLLLANNLVLFITGWESLGLVSYLILKSHVKIESKAAQGKSFFITRFASLILFLSAILSFAHFSSFDHQIIANSAFTSFTDKNIMVSLIPVLLLISAYIYTAQFPFHIWLQKAAEVPISVIVFTQIASMTTAGTYLLLRFISLFTFSPLVVFIISIAGSSSALICSIISCCQRKIRQVLIFTTITQSGYLFFLYSLNAYELVLFYLSCFLIFQISLLLCYELIIENKIMVEWQVKSRRQISILILISTVFILCLYDLSWYLLQPYLLHEKATAVRLFVYCIFATTLGLFTSFALFNIFFPISFFLNAQEKVTNIAQNIRPPKKIALFIIALLVTFGVLMFLIPFWHPDLFRNKIFILSALDVENNQIKPQKIGIYYQYLLPVSIFFACFLGTWFSYLFSAKSNLIKNKILSPINSLYDFFNQGCYISLFFNNYLFAYTKKRVSLLLWKIIDIRIIGGLVSDCGDFFMETKKIIHRITVKNKN